MREIQLVRGWFGLFDRRLPEVEIKRNAQACTHAREKSCSIIEGCMYCFIRTSSRNGADANAEVGRYSTLVECRTLIGTLERND